MIAFSILTGVQAVLALLALVEWRRGRDVPRWTVFGGLASALGFFLTASATRAVVEGPPGAVGVWVVSQEVSLLPLFVGAVLLFASPGLLTWKLWVGRRVSLAWVLAALCPFVLSAALGTLPFAVRGVPVALLVAVSFAELAAAAIGALALWGGRPERRVLLFVPLGVGGVLVALVVGGGPLVTFVLVQGLSLSLCLPSGWARSLLPFAATLAVCLSLAAFSVLVALRARFSSGGWVSWMSGLAVVLLGTALLSLALPQPTDGAHLASWVLR